MATAHGAAAQSWLRRRRESYRYQPVRSATAGSVVVAPGTAADIPVQSKPLFRNDFTINDLAVFGDRALRDLLRSGGFGISPDDLSIALSDAPRALARRVEYALPASDRSRFVAAPRRPVSPEQVDAARGRVLNALFWELTYWKTPELYEELTEGERLHPGIFRAIAPHIRGKQVLDAGAGSGRASFSALRHGAAHVHAVEPSPGLLHILEEKVARSPAGQGITPLQGRFDRIPLDDNAVDVTIACSAFTADPEQGGEPGLAELLRVTRPGGKLFVIWPRAQDYDWLAAHGFRYVALPLDHEMTVNFRSPLAALRCARRFYARNRAVVRHVLRHRTGDIPFSVLGFNPPHDYCWLGVEG